MWMSYLLNFQQPVLNFPKTVDVKGRIGSMQEAM